jgi:general secretion pathway protein M
MMDFAKAIPRRTLFLAFNAATALFLAFFVAAPILSHFTSRAEDIAESAAQLSHFQSIAINAKNLTKTSAQAGDPFLPGNEERVVSADLQASLKGIVATADVRFLGIRALPPVRSQQLRLVAVSMELEGPLAAIRSVILAIENQMPFLFVSAASLRSVSDGEDGLIRAEFKVQGAMRDKAPPSSAAEAVSR